MTGVRPRMRAAIHPDGPGLLVCAAVHLDGLQVLRLRMLLFPDAQVERSAEDIRRHVDAALLFRERDARGVPAVGVLARGVVDGQAEIVAELRARNALGLILVIAGLPDA